MRVKALVLTFVVACTVALAVPAFAQTPRAQAGWSRTLATHPELRRNPGLIFNQGYMNAHPDVNAFILAHPRIRREVHQGGGAWDTTGVWRDPGWWHQNDPGWMYDNYPEWARSHPEWRDDGDWDDQHRWHNRNWWVDNRHDWVEQHHPGWFKHHDEPFEASNPRHYRDGDHHEGEHYEHHEGEHHKGDHGKGHNQHQGDHD